MMYSPKVFWGGVHIRLWANCEWPKVSDHCRTYHPKPNRPQFRNSA